MFIHYLGSLIYLIPLDQFYCLDGNPGPLQTSKMEFFAIIVNSFKPLPISGSSILDVERLLNPWKNAAFAAKNRHNKSPTKKIFFIVVSVFSFFSKSN